MTAGDAAAEDWEPSGPEPPGRVPDFGIDSIERFTITGWHMPRAGQMGTLAVRCNGEPLDCAIVRTTRPDLDLPEAAGVAIGFEIDVPGYVWTRSGTEVGCSLQLTCDGEPLHPVPVTVTRAQAAGWIELAAAGSLEGHAGQFAVLCAIEHVRYGGFDGMLTEQARALLHEHARKMRLDEFLCAQQVGDGGQALPAIEEKPATLQRWEAQRLLNARLDAGDAGILPHVRSVIQGLRLTGEAREQFLRSIVPILCRTDEFAQMGDLLSIPALAAREATQNLWEMSTALPALVVMRDFQRATDLMGRMAKSLDKGWLNTECVRFALRHLARLQATGEVEFKSAEKLRCAYLGLLDATGGGWFSRLHDVQLIETMLDLLVDIDAYADSHRRDIVRAAIRHYGLSPVFWTRRGARDDQRRIPELDQALDAWRRLESLLEEVTTPLAERLPDLLAAIRFFFRHRNPEAPIFLREIALHVLPALNAAITPEGRRLIEELMDGSAAEGVRLAAAPLGEPNRLIHIVERVAEDLPETLREMSSRGRSPLYGAQGRGVAALRELSAVPVGDAAAAADRLAHLEGCASSLSDWPAAFLGADLLASGYLLGVRHGLDCRTQLARIGQIVRRSLAATNSALHVPPAVQSALVRLRSLGHDPSVGALLREIKEEVGRRFGARYDALFTTPDQVPVIACADRGWPGDTLVVVYSCRKYLDTRVAAIRQTWIEDLRRRDIPYVIAVGDGRDALEGDLLALDVTDHYEELPRKSLRLFDWVYRHTDAQYVLKIDDDCYLDVARYFDTLGYRKHHYYGRWIQRPIGGMDRVWHQEKSHSERGRMGIDKSPEPSTYADGGGGYSLSRTAMQVLLENAASDAGRRLTATSFMEDKLVGDLLSLSRIVASNEDYEACQRRRTFPGALPVAQFENTFFAGPLTPTKVVHLDSERDMAQAHARRASDELWPKKIWPTCWPPSINSNSSQLELLGDAARARALLEAPLVVICVVRNEMVMLPHFLDHYRSLGVECFVFVDNCSDDGSREYLLEQPDVVLYSTDTEYRNAQFGVTWQQAVMGSLCLGRWVLLADADELFVFEGCERRPLSAFVAGIEAEGANAVRVELIDMYPYGDIAEADLTCASPFELAPWFDREAVRPWRLNSGMYGSGGAVVSALRHRLTGQGAPHMFTSQKYPLLRYQPWVRLSIGLHDAAEVKVSDQKGWFAHFKYHAGFKEKVRTEIRRGQHFRNAEEYQRYAAMLREYRGGFGTEADSVKYENSMSFARHLRTSTACRIPDAIATDARPLIVWTLQRTGGTNLAARLFERLGFPNAPHEPFNPGRAHGALSELPRADRDRGALDAAMAEIVGRREQIKHCVEMVPWEVTESLVAASVAAGYSHVFLYRRQPLARLLSLHFARVSGLWGGDPEAVPDEAIFAEPLPVTDLVRHEKRCGDLLTRTWEEIARRGGAPMALAYEDVYLAVTPAACHRVLLPVIAALGLSKGAQDDGAFVDEIVARGEQGTRHRYTAFAGIDRLQAALRDVRGFVPLPPGRSIEVTAIQPEVSWVLHTTLDWVPRVAHPGEPMNLGGVIVLAESAPPCRLLCVAGTVTSEVAWDIASPAMAASYPAGANSANARFALSPRAPADGKPVEIQLLDQYGGCTPLFRVRVLDEFAP